MEKIILFYKFVPVADPQTAMFWQRALCEKLNLKGRIIIAEHGINATLGGKVEDLKKYVKEMNIHPDFKKIHYKWSQAEDRDFPRLSVKVRDELVGFNATDELKVNQSGVVNGGKHLKPKALHKLLEEKGDQVIFYDGRNAYEAEVGHFKGAIIPATSTTRDFKLDLDNGEIAQYKDRPIVTYCTGGIRCEILTSLMKNRGFKEVYQLDGGIVTYGDTFKDDGYWEGKLYVFDGRMVTAFSDQAKDIADCVHCEGKTSRFINCANKQCNKLILVCENCEQEVTCSKECNKISKTQALHTASKQ